MCVSADGFAELSAYEYEGVFNSITFLVEGSSPEVVLGGPEDSLNFFGVIECSCQETNLLISQLFEDHRGTTAKSFSEIS